MNALVSNAELTFSTLILFNTHAEFSKITAMHATSLKYFTCLKKLKMKENKKEI